MTAALFSLHWKASRWMLLPLTLAAFGLPLLYVRRFTEAAGRGLVWDANAVMDVTSNLMPSFPMLACAVGVLLGITAWLQDHRQRSVYAMTLPLPRWRYVLVKFGAGAAVAVVPAAALLVGALVAATSLPIPAGLRVYPVWLAVRFLLAVLLVYAGVFSLAAGRIRTAVLVLGVILAGPIVAELAVALVEKVQPDVILGSPVEWFWDVLLTAGGPLRILNGSWGLIDV